MDPEEWVGLGHMTTGNPAEGGTAQQQQEQWKRTHAESKIVGSKNRCI